METTSLLSVVATPALFFCTIFCWLDAMILYKIVLKIRAKRESEDTND